MAVLATGGFNLLRYEPGNPEFPTLPDGLQIGHPIDLSRVAGFRAGEVRKSQVFASAPGNDRQRFGGWQTETTWLNPAVIDFGVITSPIRRTVSLYNARTVSNDVTGYDSGTTGVNLITPTLTQTLQPYAGVDFTIEAVTTGPSEFNELVTFTTAFGPMTFRVIGRRVFSLSVRPQRPIRETLRFKTDLIRSDDGTEKAYSLLRSPTSNVEYTVLFTDDLERIRFRNDFIAGESALIVSAQKWWEQTALLAPVSAVDLSLNVEWPSYSSFFAGESISVVSPDGQVVTEATIESVETGPDPYIENVVLHIPFDGADGAKTATDYSSLARTVNFTGADTEIDTSQSKFGGASLFCSNTNFSVEVPHDDADKFADTDWTIEFWMRPTAADLTASCMIAKWDNRDAGTIQWVWTMQTGFVRLNTYKAGLQSNLYYAFTTEIAADTWVHMMFSQSAGSIRVFADGVELGGGQTLAVTPNDLNTRLSIGDYYNGGFHNTFNGWIDEVRITMGVARETVAFTPPASPFPRIADAYTVLNFSTQIGTALDLGSYVMPVGLGYVSKLPKWGVYPVNLESVDYEIAMNQQIDVSGLPSMFPTLNGTPILEFCNEMTGRTKSVNLRRAEDTLDSGLSNRIAFSQYPYADEIQSFNLSLDTKKKIWDWRRFLYYIKGSYLEIYVPTFQNDFPNVTTTASNVFSMTDTDYATLFGTTSPADRRGALRFQYADGTIQYRTITQVVDNGATEQFTVDSAVLAGTPKISYMNRARILGDTATFEFLWPEQATLSF